MIFKLDDLKGRAYDCFVKNTEFKSNLYQIIRISRLKNE